LRQQEGRSFSENSEVFPSQLQRNFYNENRNVPMSDRRLLCIQST